MEIEDQPAFTKETEKKGGKKGKPNPANSMSMPRIEIHNPITCESPVEDGKKPKYPKRGKQEA